MGSQTWEYNGNSFELDMRDAVQAERYEDAAELLQKEYEEIPKGIKMSERLRAQCGCIGRFFERVFNRPDAAGLMFGGQLNLGEYNDAYYAFLDFIVAQGEAERRRLDEKMAKYSLSRIKGREKE